MILLASKVDMVSGLEQRNNVFPGSEGSNAMRLGPSAQIVKAQGGFVMATMSRASSVL